MDENEFSYSSEEDLKDLERELAKDQKPKTIMLPGEKRKRKKRTEEAVREITMQEVQLKERMEKELKAARRKLAKQRGSNAEPTV